MTNENIPSGGDERETKERTLTLKNVLDVVLPLLILALGVGLVLYYIIWPAAGYMTSDCTDSLRWAEATYESGQLVSDNFYYAAILPLGGNLLFLPFVALFGYSQAAQISGLVVFALLFAAALYYLAFGIGLNRYYSAGLVAVFMLVMSSSQSSACGSMFYYNLGLSLLRVRQSCRILREGGFVCQAGRRALRTGRGWLSLLYSWCWPQPTGCRLRLPDPTAGSELRPSGSLTRGEPPENMTLVVLASAVWRPP